MTKQVSEIIKYNDREYLLEEYLLEEYFKDNPEKNLTEKLSQVFGVVILLIMKSSTTNF